MKRISSIPITSLRWLTKIAMLSILFLSTQSLAQKNTDIKSVDIVSAYRPKIGSLSKFQFIPTLPVSDSVKLTLLPLATWRPLLPAYAVTSMRPLAFATDTTSIFATRFYAKVGYGNLRSPYLHLFYNKAIGSQQGYQASVFHEAATGKLPYQTFGQTKLSIDGFKNISAVKIGGGVGLQQDVVYRFGFRKPLSTIPSPIALKTIYSALHFQLRAQSARPSSSGIAYQGNLEGGFFFDQRSTQERLIRATFPVEKKWNDKWAATAHFTLQQAVLSPAQRSIITNSLATANIIVAHSGRLVTLHAGVQPSWDQDGLRLMPQLRGSIKIDSSRLYIDGGIEGVTQFRSFQSLFQQNNWINIPAQLKNTRTTRFVLGVGGAVTPYMSYRIQTSLSRIENIPLFVNDTAAQTDGSSFFVWVEPRLKQFQLSGEVHYQLMERIAIYSTLALSTYSGLQRHQQAWGLLPVEWKTTFHVSLLRNLSIDLESLVWRGSLFLQSDGKAGRSKGAADINTQFVYKIHPSWQIWTRFNNLLNQTYQRWNQYPVYGMNFMAGVVFSPEPKR
jgi:hypothetical protein